MRRSLALAAGALLLLCPAASAQDFSFVVILPALPGAHAVKQTEIPASVTGSVTVSFHGSAAAGCESRGVCDTEGTLQWRPGAEAGLGAIRFIQHGRHRMTESLDFQDGNTVEATRRRRADGSVALCSDGGQALGSISSAGGPGLNSLSVRLADEGDFPDIFRTRCAGPLAKDIVPLLPVRPLSSSVLRGRRPVVNLSTVRPFSAAGYAGTVRSSVVIRFHRPMHTPPLPDQTRPVRFRTVDARYRIEDVTGSVTESFRGLDSIDSCDPFGSCGASGTITERVPGAAGTLEVEAITRSRISPRRAFALFGAAKGKVGRLSASGAGEWRSRSASLSAAVSFEPGSPACSDSEAVRSGALKADVSARGMRVSLLIGPFAVDPFVTRCQGPATADLAPAGTVASGSVPARALRKSVIHLVLSRAGTERAGNGYRGSISSRLVVSLRRVSVRTRTFTLPF